MGLQSQSIQGGRLTITNTEGVTLEWRRNDVNARGRETVIAEILAHCGYGDMDPDEAHFTLDGQNNIVTVAWGKFGPGGLTT